MANQFTDIDKNDIEISISTRFFIPHNVVCKSRCTFCYERIMSKLCPNIAIKYIHPYSEESFEEYIKLLTHLLETGQISEKDELAVKKINDSYYYFPQADFFSLGLTTEQIEVLVKNKLLKTIYTTGLHVDPDLIKYLFAKYPDLQAKLSIITLYPEIRPKLMHPENDVKSLMKILKLFKRTSYYLIYMGKEQVAYDIDILAEYAEKNGCSFLLSKMFYHKFSPDYIREYTEQGRREFEGILSYLENGNEHLKRMLNHVNLIPESEIYGFKFKKDLEGMLSVCKDNCNEVIFCSSGAYPFIRNIMRSAHVLSSDTCFGGCTNFTLGMTVGRILEKIGELLEEGIDLKTVYLPSSMFYIERKYDFELKGVDVLREAYPSLEFVVIDVPFSMLFSTVTVEECRAYLSEHGGFK